MQARSFSSRSRLEVTELKQIPVPDNNNLTEFAGNIQRLISGLVEPLKTNAALDREEIDLLWWVLNDWSNIAERKISEVNQVQNAVLCGLEISTNLRRLPSDAHYKLAVQSIRNVELYSGSEIIAEMSDLLEPVSVYLKKTVDG